MISQAGWAASWSLPRLVERARENDYRVKEAQAQLRWYRAKYDEARWAWFPKVEGYVGIAGPTPEAKNNGLGGPPLTRSSLMYDLDFGDPGVMLRAEASAILPIYTFGKLTALEKAGAKGVEAGTALATTAKDEAEYQMSQAYWGYCLAQSGQQVISETLTRLDEASKILTRLREQGSEQVTQMDMYKVDFYRRQAQVQVAVAQSGANFALAAIRLLVAADQDEQIEVELEPLENISGTLIPLEQYVQTSRAFRPELSAIEAGIAAREQEVFIRERMYYPDFGIAGFARWVWTTNSTRQRSPFAYDPYNDLSAGLALVMRYSFDFPQKGIVLEQSRAELEKMFHQRDLIVGAVRLEITKDWNDTNAALAKAAQQTEAEKSARRWATAAFTAFDLGTGETRDLVDSFVALASASAARFQALHDARVGLTALNRASGHRTDLVPVVAKEELPPPVLLQPKNK